MPVVAPTLISPMKTPLRFLLGKSRDRMIAVINKPPPAHPDRALPRRNTASLEAAAVTNKPIERMIEENNT